MVDRPVISSASLADLPRDELWHYGRKLGLCAEANTPRGELLRIIRERQKLLADLDHAALIDVVVWARLPVRRSAGKEQLAQYIATIVKPRFDGLSDRGLTALARLHGVELQEGDQRTTIEKRLRRKAGLWARVQAKRRSVVGSLLTRLVEGGNPEGDYQFLPEEEGSSLKETIENVGVVGGIAQKLRGAADLYVGEKLDEIERRIDSKLDEIDRRLGEWRDQEVRNRLRIIKITLVTAIIVAVISLGYDYMKSRSEAAMEAREPVAGRTGDPPAKHGM